MEVVRLLDVRVIEFLQGSLRRAFAQSHVEEDEHRADEVVDISGPLVICLADAAIAFVSFSGEDRTLSRQKTPRHWSTASSDVLTGVGARRPSVHIVTRMLLLALALQLRNAGQWTHSVQ